jgi:hypothetical protein
MSYSIGQFRRTQLSADSYQNPQTYTLTTVKNDSGITQFDDICIQLQGANILNSKTSYYLKFRVKQRTDSVQDFTLKLENSSIDEDTIQSVDYYSVDYGSDYTYFELIITPNSTYDQIILELNRIALDYSIENTLKDTHGRVMSCEIIEFYSIYNVIDYLSSSYAGLSELSKIGIQGPPGLIMCINGEQIRIGRTGIYEINNGLTIQSIGFILKESTFYSDGLDYFIMDFQY